MTVMGEELRTDPVAMAKLLAIKVMRSWYGTDSGRYELEIMLLQVPYLVLVLWGTLGSLRSDPVRRNFAVCIWVVVLYLWGMTVVVYSMLRYMMPAMGLLFVLIPGAFLVRGAVQPSLATKKDE
jgi:hypothetical protein